MDYFMPTHLFTGDDCIARNAGALKAIGGSCLIATGKHAAKASGAMDDVERALESQGIAYTIWDGVTENPPVASCIEAGRLAAERGAEFILGVGGGSALDASKAIAVFAANPELDEAGFYAKAWANDPMPIVLVGTTAGTGSEVTKVSVLTDSIARKHSIHDDRLFATVSYGDPRYTGSCSHTTTLTCGVDILAHATEGYFSNKCDEISRAYAVRAIRMLVGPLSRAAAGEELAHE
ncbi:MAG: iron-containing alcohol dehydrogenase, partial [Atopobiaceae bacterium]|nr:iron-containing alcohol dehydrogenase [Atopobiaceae bacterium]